MSDIVDRAQEQEERFRMQALARVRRCGAGSASASRCVDCGDEIGAARRAAVPGAQRCVQCARIVERYGRLQGP